MLARHAESLFWCGRYLERAEDTAQADGAHVEREQLAVAAHDLLGRHLRDAVQLDRRQLQVFVTDMLSYHDPGVLDPEQVYQAAKKKTTGSRGKRRMR